MNISEGLTPIFSRFAQDAKEKLSICVPDDASLRGVTHFAKSILLASVVGLSALSTPAHADFDVGQILSGISHLNQSAARKAEYGLSSSRAESLAKSQTRRHTSHQDMGLLTLEGRTRYIDETLESIGVEYSEKSSRSTQVVFDPRSHYFTFNINPKDIKPMLYSGVAINRKEAIEYLKAKEAGVGLAITWGLEKNADYFETMTRGANVHSFDRVIRAFSGGIEDVQRVKTNGDYDIVMTDVAIRATQNLMGDAFATLYLLSLNRLDIVKSAILMNEEKSELFARQFGSNQTTWMPNDSQTAALMRSIVGAYNKNRIQPSDMSHEDMARAALQFAQREFERQVAAGVYGSSQVFGEVAQIFTERPRHAINNGHSTEFEPF